MTDNDLDAAIDRVAQLWTADEPGPELRVRVIGHLADESGHRGRNWSGMLLPAAVAAAIVIAVVVRRPPAGDAVLTARAFGAVNVPLPAAAPALTDIIERARLEPNAKQDEPMRRRPDVVPITASAIDRLAPPPLDVTSLAVGTMDEGTSIQVPQLEPITPLQIAPIADPQGERP